MCWKIAASLICAAVLAGCATRYNERYPVVEMVDPVTEVTPHVRE